MLVGRTRDCDRRSDPSGTRNLLRLAAHLSCDALQAASLSLTDSEGPARRDHES